MSEKPLNDRLRILRDRTAEIARRSGDAVSDMMDRSKPFVEEQRALLVEKARAAGERARLLAFPEEPSEILSRSVLFRPTPEAGSGPTIRSVEWKADAAVALSAFGLIAFDKQVTDLTAQIFHGSGAHQDLSRVLFHVDHDEIHRWIDTVPGSGVRGGGIVHRLEWGHDLEAAHKLYDEHGVEGLLVWIQHMVQDTMSSTGVPIPGGERLSHWLVQHGAKEGNAALAVSLNVAELAGSILAGASMLRIAALLVELQKHFRVKKRLERAKEATAIGDLDAAIAHYKEAQSLADHREPEIDLALGWAYAMTGRPRAESFLAFRSAAEGLAAKDHALDRDGVLISLRGTASMLALTQAAQVLELDSMKGAWQNELDRIARGGVAAFEAQAIAYCEGFLPEIRGKRLPLRLRPLSAAANYYLAARLSASVPFVPTSNDFGRLAARALNLLEEAEALHPGEERILGVRRRWAAELAPGEIIISPKAGIRGQAATAPMGAFPIPEAL